MPAVIKILDDDLINKIAAGEVVERPASVVKELIENALDAQADCILLEVAQGGKKLIRVSDNGSGMGEDNLKLAVLRHATSKIASFADLEHLESLGFRGEALPAIAAASSMTITSRSAADTMATALQLAASTITRVSKQGTPVGTCVEVADLFVKLPARAKFLRSVATESSHIHELIEAFGLAYPQVEFKVMQDDRPVLIWPKAKDLAIRLRDVFSSQVTQHLYPLEAQGGPLKLSGFMGHPNISRSQSSGLFVFVNGRWIQDRLILHAIREAYANLLMQGRYPVCVLKLAMPSSEVDVNVHPAKAQVRFAHPGQVHDLIVRELRETLKMAPWSLRDQNQGGKMPGEVIGNRVAVPSDAVQAVLNASHRVPMFVSDHFPQLSFDQGLHRPALGTQPFHGLSVLGQLWQTYILCQSETKLVLIDQHAAHERLGFEALKVAYARAPLQIQELMLPEVFDLSASESEVIQNHLEDLLPLGVELTFLGGTSYALKGVPVLLQGRFNTVGWLKDLAQELLQAGRSTALKDMMDHVLETMACHQQVRAGDVLTVPEMQALIHQLAGEDFAYHCPHGRPVMVEFAQEQIERWFKRRL